ncbi:hypothetical protein DFQ01_12116 [Paenibacillus cellulosilyticus]|uniref:Uncharacterized protein n=1 Tax=Paenibacillus cellulosilyticus TaxID=375489 RepID=A0A2V2YPT9_9BACL|nr:hypothetical protein [Paenibacillus cellulosilyticus]PWV97374.1 hypothetical protein DFQ01_12116 [Paenibacillus cellulosilyticus]QKS48582.1 hypothetical protein HUB94_30595 [Paenibacillus cellulosilyticus]
MLREIGNAFSVMIMWIIRVIVIGFFLYYFQKFSDLITQYDINVRLAQSAVQASQLANESILVALTYIGKLLVVIAAVIVFESMYRNGRRTALREKMALKSE